MDDIFNQYGMQLAKCMEVIDNLAARFEARKTQPGIGIFKTDHVPYILCADNIIPTPSVLLLSRRWNSNHGLIQDQSEGVDGWSQTFYTRGHPLLN
uniref:Uncharacterized protein n=1 Tax=Oryza glumipatula TaxID=40148 RepID=A0A0E0AI97_9ORYZ